MCLLNQEHQKLILHLQSQRTDWILSRSYTIEDGQKIKPWVNFHSNTTDLCIATDSIAIDITFLTTRHQTPSTENTAATEHNLTWLQWFLRMLLGGRGGGGEKPVFYSVFLCLHSYLLAVLSFTALKSYRNIVFPQVYCEAGKFTSLIDFTPALTRMHNHLKAGI